MSHTRPYGSWPSPITAAAVAAGSHPVDSARYVDGEIWWSERLPQEGGRSALRRVISGREETLLPPPWDARSRVHEYGGGAWAAGDARAFQFVEKSDQRVWSVTLGRAPHPLTPGGLGMRFGDLTSAEDVLLAVRETHHAGVRAPTRDIVAIPLDGSASDDAGALRVVVAGSDFLAYPRLSPDGTQLAWIAWDRPNMPWDGTELRVGAMVGGRVPAWVTLAGAPGESVLQPEWTGSVAVTYLSDRSGWWNLYRHVDEETLPLAPAQAETGGPLWNLGIRWFLPVGDGRIIAVRTVGADELVIIDPEAGTLTPIVSPVTSRVLLDDVCNSKVLFHGAGSATLGGLWELDLDTPVPLPRLVRSAVDEHPDAAWLPVARAVSVEGPRGPVHAFAYPPTNPDVEGPRSELPPYVVLAHGGPTAHASGGAALDIAFFTSRGIGVLDVNYGGSTGYGRAYRERLDGEWGIVDRDDVIAAASGLADQGIADGARLAIRGGSAGGWTVLCALTASDRFAAGISRYGVADLRALAADTHDFEARYLDGLVGPLPASESVYLDRSPLSHLERFTTPMLIEQGLDDDVVPPTQSEAVRDALVRKGIPHAYLAFEGEAHGFRRAETIIRSLEAEVAFLGRILEFETPGLPEIVLS